MSEAAPALVPIFRSQSQLRLLAHLFLHPDTEYTLSDLERTLRIPQQTVSREVGRLVRAGLLRSRAVGRAQVVRANETSPYFPDLAGLLLKALGPRPLLAEALVLVEGVTDAYLFGSWARRYTGQPGLPPGDIDVAVIGDPDVDEVFTAVGSAARALQQEVNPVIIPPREWAAAKSGFVREVRNGPLVPIFEPEEQPGHADNR